VTTTNPNLRVLLLVGAIALVGAALATFTLQRRAPATSSSPAPVAAKAARPSAAATPKPVATRPAVKPAQPRAVVPRVQPVAAAADPDVRAALAAGLPTPGANAFAGRDVVVVTLYDPSSSLDGTSVAEARAGARLARAGFVGVDTRREGATAKLVAKLGVLRTPQTIVYAQPGLAVVTRFDGFADRQTVAQAAVNAAPAAVPADAALAAWARGADRLCDRAAAGYASVAPANARELQAVEPRLRRIGRSFLTGLAALPAPAARGGDVQRLVELERRNVAVREQLVQTAARGDVTVGAMTKAVHRRTSADADALALALGATHCAGAL
jgi:hypothetical protein